MELFRHQRTRNYRMVKKTETITQRTCVDCGRDISKLHHNTLRCKTCSAKRKQQQDQQRHKETREKTLQWLYFVENPETQELIHRSARGSKLRYWLDKICKQLTVQELDFLLQLWDWRVREPLLPPPQKREYRTCAGIVRDWRDYNVINQVFGNISFDAETGVIFNPDGSCLTVDFDEDNEAYLIRNSEGAIICKY